MYVLVGYCVVLSSKNLLYFPIISINLFYSEAKTVCDIDFLVGFETEFILLETTHPVTPTDIHSWSSAHSLRSGSTSAIVVAEMVNAIELSGIEVQIYHGEAAPGQVCLINKFEKTGLTI